MGTVGRSGSGGSWRTRKFGSREEAEGGEIFVTSGFAQIRDDVRTSVTSNRLRGVWLEPFWQRFPVPPTTYNRKYCINIIQQSGMSNRYCGAFDGQYEAIRCTMPYMPLHHIGYYMITASRMIWNGGRRVGFQFQPPTYRNRYRGLCSRLGRTRPR